MGVQGPTRDLGPCDPVFDSTSLGATLGGVKFMYTEDDTPVKEDQEGTSSVDDVVTGYNCSVVIPLTRMGLAALTALLAGASGSGTAAASGTMTVKSTVGTSRYDRAKELILKPIVNGVASVDSSEWLHVFKASPAPNFELGYDATGQRVYNMTFKGYADRTAGVATKRIWRIGPAHD